MSSGVGRRIAGIIQPRGHRERASVTFRHVRSFILPRVIDGSNYATGMRGCSACARLVDDSAVACAACGEASDADASPLIDRRYEVERVLGSGAMGIVYLARDIYLGRRIAIKVVSTAIARVPAVEAQLRSEASALPTVRSEHALQAPPSA